MKAAVIAIDGPIASGKSTVGRLLAQCLGYPFLDTGAMYRAATWLALERGIDPKDEPALSQLAAEARMELRPPSPNSPHPYAILMDGRDVTDQLRRPEVEAWVSLVSQVRGVREALVAQQQRMAEGGGVIMAGRDIGTVVLPKADLKVYLEASAKVRAERRYRELKEKGLGPNRQRVMAELAERDRLDSQRSLSPLRPARDAVVIHTDDLNLDQVVAKVLALIERD